MPPREFETGKGFKTWPKEIVITERIRRLKSATDTKGRNEYRDEYTLPMSLRTEIQLYNKLYRAYGDKYVIVWRGDERYRRPPGFHFDGKDSIRYKGIEKPGLSQAEWDSALENDVNTPEWYYEFAILDFEMYYDPDVAPGINNLTITQEQLVEHFGKEVIKDSNILWRNVRAYLRRFASKSNPPAAIEIKRRMEGDMSPMSRSKYTTSDLNRDKIEAFQNFYNHTNSPYTYLVLWFAEGPFIGQVNYSTAYWSAANSNVKLTKKSGVGKESGNPETHPEEYEPTAIVPNGPFVPFTGKLPGFPTGSGAGPVIPEATPTAEPATSVAATPTPPEAAPAATEAEPVPAAAPPSRNMVEMLMSRNKPAAPTILKVRRRTNESDSKQPDIRHHFLRHTE